MESVINIPGKCLKELVVQKTKASWSVRNAEITGKVEVRWSGLVLSICGGAEVVEGRNTWNEVVEMTRIIAHQGGLVVNGGQDSGVMLASAKNFPENTIGLVVPQTKTSKLGNYAVVEDYSTRTTIATKHPNVVVFEGGVGTTEEWAMVLREIKESLAANVKPPTLYLHEYWKPVFNSLWDIRSMPKRIMDQVKFFSHSKEVIDLILN